MTDILQELQKITHIQLLDEEKDKILRSVIVMQSRIKSYIEDSESEWAEASKVYKDKALHKAEISTMAKNRIIELYYKKSKEINEASNALFVQLAHEIKE